MDSPVSLPTAQNAISPSDRARLHRFLVISGILIACFVVPLYQVILFSLNSELYSFIVIVPFISAYLIWIDRHRFFPAGAQLHPLWSVLFAVIGCTLLFLFLQTATKVDSLALSIYSFVCFGAATACFFLGRKSLRLIAFPLAFLIFLAPFPVAFEAGLETLLQHGSSWIAHRLFDLSSMPVYREGTLFQLPGFSMQVAPECSGIRSTLALFLVSLVAGQMFLRSPWKRTTLAAVVLPIALVRNGFRVFVIGELCVKVGPHMINSWIHRHGGPAFFALSLIPFSIILFLLYKTDQRSANKDRHPIS